MANFGENVMKLEEITENQVELRAQISNLRKEAASLKEESSTTTTDEALAEDVSIEGEA